jgi:hypothetical protein
MLLQCSTRCLGSEAVSNMVRPTLYTTCSQHHIRCKSTCGTRSRPSSHALGCKHNVTAAMSGCDVQTTRTMSQKCGSYTANLPHSAGQMSRPLLQLTRSCISGDGHGQPCIEQQQCSISSDLKVCNSGDVLHIRQPPSQHDLNSQVSLTL